IASSVVQRFPELVINKKKEVRTGAMLDMAERPFAFASGSKLSFWKRRIYSLVKVDNITYELDTQANESRSSRTSEEIVPQGTYADEENPAEVVQGSCRDQKYPPENPKNMEGDNAKPFKWETG
ncbi:hypothetical protein MKW94_004789, partial [Papaver nudicaule]|nr:hypothetical protein [Papaver nudicaule]MCL7044510.1 hypothetical protein [Papaver nudicaule]